LTLGSREHGLKAGWAALIPPGLPHACASAPGRHIEGVALCLSPGLVAKALGRERIARDGCCFSCEGLHARLVQAFGRVLAARSAEAAERRAGAMIRAVFAASGRVEPEASCPDVLPEPVRKALDVLESRPQGDLSLKELAGLVRVSPYHLARLFSRRVGVPPHVYQTLSQLRLARKQLLSGMSLAETALASGFYDQSHLCLRFKHYMGVTPGQFQRGAR